MKTAAEMIVNASRSHLAEGKKGHLSGPDEIAPSIQAKLSSYQVRWLNKQCDKLKSKKGKVLTEAFDEWLVRHSD